MKALAALAHALFGKLNFCSLAGALAGVVVGFFCAIALLQLAETPMIIPAADLLKGALILSLVAWVVLLVFVGIWLRYGVTQIALLTFFIAVLTSVLTVFVNYAVQFAPAAVALGIIAGIVAGLILCWFCRPGQSGVKA